MVPNFHRVAQAGGGSPKRITPGSPLTTSLAPILHGRRRNGLASPSTSIAAMDKAQCSGADGPMQNNATSALQSRSQPAFLESATKTAETRSSNNIFNNHATGVAFAGTAVLVGGTAALYSSILQHPSSTMTPLAIVYMLLLALQTSIQPRISKKYISPKSNKVSVALVEEVIKTTMATAIFWVATPKALQIEALQGWTLPSSLAVAGFPALLYAIQGVLTYRAHQELDSVTFNGLSQTKTLFAALCCYIVMGTRQSPLQMVALALLFVSALVFQQISLPVLPFGKLLETQLGKNLAGRETQQLRAMSFIGTPARDQQELSIASSSNNDSSSCSNDSSSLSAVVQDNNSNYEHDPADDAAATGADTSCDQSTGMLVMRAGMLSCFSATFCSGLAGAFSQKGLQLVGGSGRNAFLYTIEVSFFSAVYLLVSQLVLKPPQRNKRRSITTSSIRSNSSNAFYHSWFDHWTWPTLIPITLKAVGGILTALVHKHAGSVVKGFALMFGLVLSGVLQTLWFHEDTNAIAVSSAAATTVGEEPSASQQQLHRSVTPLGFHQVLGTVIVMISSWLHFTNPPVGPP